MIKDTAEVRVLNAPSLSCVPNNISYVFKTLIVGNLPPHSAPERAETYQRVHIKMEEYGAFSCGTIQGQLKCVGYAIDGSTLIYANVIATTISAREAWKASIDLGSEMTLIKSERYYGDAITVPRDGKDKIKFAYNHDKYNLPILKARQIVSLLKSVADPAQANLGRYIMETSIDNAQWALISAVSEITGLFIRPEWGQRLWYLANAGRWISKCDAEPIPFWRVEQSGDIWRTVVQLAVAQGIFSIFS